MVGAELSHIEIQFNHETCDGRSTRSRRFFPLSLVCSSSSFIFFVLYQEMRCYLRMNTAESLCIGNFFSIFMLSDRPMSEQETQIFNPPDNFFWKRKLVEEWSPKNIRKKYFYCLIWSIVCDNVSVRWESSGRHLLFLWSMYSTIFFAISCRPGS